MKTRPSSKPNFHKLLTAFMHGLQADYAAIEENYREFQEGNADEVALAKDNAIAAQAVLCAWEILYGQIQDVIADEDGMMEDMQLGCPKDDKHDFRPEIKRQKELLKNIN